jgi:hypothetical protein
MSMAVPVTLAEQAPATLCDQPCPQPLTHNLTVCPPCDHNPSTLPKNYTPVGKRP